MHYPHHHHNLETLNVEVNPDDLELLVDSAFRVDEDAKSGDIQLLGVMHANNI